MTIVLQPSFKRNCLLPSGLYVLALLIGCWFGPSLFAAPPDATESVTAAYHFDEQMVVGGIEVAGDSLQAALKQSGADAEHADRMNKEALQAANSLGWLVIALAEFSNGSEEVKKALFRIKSEFGYISLPYWMGDEQRRRDIARSYSFSSGDGIVALRPPSPEILYSLCTKAEKAITGRSGFKFEGYSGPAYGNID